MKKSKFKKGEKVDIAIIDKKSYYLIGGKNGWEKEDWTTTSIECDFCSHKWQAVHPAELCKLECPKCGNMTRF